ncbi:3-isopropylmalate dehydratase [Ancylobacter pratisalsi]|uniref:3-isopropylmalate dehydratase n=1 Tax=Ancylobacter pratisalsi TaxID=1745854 RepID=A0A6P1YTX9_9HYPH|nr:3-isopropylmalate dehydratase [Ancylobacter pratisalsi]QIB36485.1 3-isopropylmalate dehydratase [Ancylobacter pratisalsi]
MIRGHVWKFGANINTDVIMPGHVYDQSEAIQTKAAFAGVRPGFSDIFQAGDLIVAGTNFGTGSSRPAARSLRNLGCACLVADSINSLFFRNCVNFGLLALECEGVSALVEEGGELEIDIDNWQLREIGTGKVLPILPVPPRLLAIMRGGGIFPVLEREGLIVVQR